jgi:hypothetical protein
MNYIVDIFVIKINSLFLHMHSATNIVRIKKAVLAKLRTVNSKLQK